MTRSVVPTAEYASFSSLKACGDWRPASSRGPVSTSRSIVDGSKGSLPVALRATLPPVDKNPRLTVRRASKDDRDALAGLATSLPLRRALTLAFGNLVEDSDAIRRYQQWNVDVLLAGGIVYIDEHLTAVAGGRVHPPGLSARLRLAVLPPWRKGALRGRYRYPPVPSEARRRVAAVSKASMSLVPPGRSFHWSLWGTTSDGPGLEEVGQALLGESSSAGLPAVTTTTDDDTRSMAHLQLLGFEQTGEVPFPGADDTTLIGWQHSP